MAIFPDMHYYKCVRGQDLKEITEESFPGFISLPLAVVTFSSPWCASCKKVASSLDALSQELQGRVSFGTCDISAFPRIASSLEVFGLPSVIVFKNGVEVKRFTGPVTGKAVMDALKELP